MAQMPIIDKLAMRLYRALLQVQPRLPAEISETLRQDSGGMSIAWTFSLTLASYALKDETGVPSSLENIGVWRFVSSLGSLMLLVPGELKEAIAIAQRGSDSSATIDSVAKQLKAAFDSLVGIQQSAMLAWLKGADFKAAAAGFSREYPEATTASSEEPPPKAPSANRARNFDRAGFPPRRTVGGQPVGGPTILVRREESNEDIPAPALTNQDITRATLHSLGWSVADVDRIVAGPSGEHGDYYKWRQVLRTYSSLKKLERMRFQKLVDEVERGFNKDDMDGVSVGDVGDLREVEALDIRSAPELWSAYKVLSVNERMKMAKWILANEKGFTTEELKSTDLGKIPRSEVDI